MKTSPVIKKVVLSVCLLISILISGCMKLNTNSNILTGIYHKVPDWSVTDTISMGNRTHYSKQYDINDDGVDDFIIKEISPQDYGYFTGYLYCLNQILVQGSKEPSWPDSIPYYYIPEITSAHTISARDTFFNDNIIPYPRLFIRSVSLTLTRTDTHYTAFNVMINNERHYAWVKFREIFNLNITTDPGAEYGTVKILESGYCNTPNTEIKAGEW